MIGEKIKITADKLEVGHSFNFNASFEFYVCTGVLVLTFEICTERGYPKSVEGNVEILAGKRRYVVPPYCDVYLLIKKSSPYGK